jgi:hypothetical protein
MILLKRANSDSRERRRAWTTREWRMMTRATTHESCANRRAARGTNHATAMDATAMEFYIWFGRGGGLTVSPQDDDTVTGARSMRRCRGETTARLGAWVTVGGSTVEPEQRKPVARTWRACAHKCPADWAVATMRAQRQMEALLASARTIYQSAARGWKREIRGEREKKRGSPRTHDDGRDGEVLRQGHGRRRGERLGEVAGERAQERGCRGELGRRSRHDGGKVVAGRMWKGAQRGPSGSRHGATVSRVLWRRLELEYDRVEAAEGLLCMGVRQGEGSGGTPSSRLHADRKLCAREKIGSGKFFPLFFLNRTRCTSARKICMRVGAHAAMRDDGYG